MSLNRRSLLSVFGIGAVAVPAIGAKEAARMVGLDTSMNAPLGSSVCEAAGGPVGVSFWGSPIQIAMDAAEHGKRWPESYDHMKSWSKSYKASAAARDYAAMRLLQQKLERDESFMQAVASQLKVAL